MLSQDILSQELMTIREAFNFEIGDKFQHRISGLLISGNYISPNADRISIINKYYSIGQDTLFYVEHHDSYNTQVSWEGGPHLVYNFWTRTDTIFYVDLDSSLLYFDQGFEFSQYSYQSAELCDSLIQGCSYYLGPGFENDKYIDEYGKGLGHTFSKDSIYQYPSPWSTIELFYYKKGDLSCGSPDLTTVGIKEPLIELEDFSIYPNPVESTIFLNNQTNQDEFQLSILSAIGESIMKMHLRGKTNSIDINHLKSGLYLLNFKTDNKNVTIKLIKK